MTDFVNGSGYSRYGLSTDPNIIVEQCVKKAWDDTRDKNPFMSILHMMERKGTKYGPRKSKKIVFGIGDYFKTAATLAAAMAYNATTITLTYDRFFAGDMFYLYDTATGKYANVRLTGQVAGAKYNCVVTSTSATSGSFATATTTVKVLHSSVPNDGKARSPLSAKGNVGLNWMQRGRDTVGMGQAEQSEEFIIDHSIEGLTRKGFEFYAEKKNLSAYLMFNAKGNADVDSNYENQLAGGLPYFYNPHGATFAEASGYRNLACSDSEFVGTNKVISGSTFDYANMRKWLYDMTKNGSKDKIVMLGGDTFLELVSVLSDSVAVYQKDLKMLIPSMPSPWVIPMMDFGVARVWFVLDRSIDGLYTPITVSGVTADSSKWMVAVDPMHLGYVPLVMKGKVMTPHISNIAAVDNDSFERVEFDSFDTLIIDEPRSGGYLGLYTGA